ncbi:HEAT repeat domain-containing protein [Gloeobacter kilaueensis]|uniref:Oxidoreductase/HEAT repeat-containing protein n=1 Tax=Gloeobacter kilaueensis (strain ATCC BAA-2537 / CCAP 1431/1 / ULC 316 / JS1) TaxID=1183438 RepID=U5QNN3_GLOK1|nr:HEAT repeat domain-containing protein [Gloeobacter kilaueensis]AGY60536.1 oxidoreductase/HEAT repeat-containing protein [Gloeobacter kilaueensis JS1]
MAHSQILPHPPEATDALLEVVHAQLAAGHFDPGDTALLAHMVEALADSRGMARLAIVEAFGQIGTPAVPLLIEGLAHHPNPVVRRSCGKALAKTGDPRAVPTLIAALLYDEDNVARSSAAGALAKVGAAAVPDLLVVLAADHPGSAKGHAAWALAFMGAEVADGLRAAYDSEAADVRTAVIGAIAGLDPELAAPHHYALLTTALADPAAPVRAEAAAALGNLEYTPAVASLIDRLTDPSPEVRRTVALALMKIAHPAALPALRAQLAQEEQPEVRPVLALALAQIEKHLSAEPPCN